MKLVVLIIMITIIIFSTIAKSSNLRNKHPFHNDTFNQQNYVYEKSSNVLKFQKNENKFDRILEERIEKIDFDYVLLNLNIIEHKIDEFRSKLGAKKLFEKSQLLSSDNRVNDRLLNDIYFGEYLDLIEDIQSSLELNDQKEILAEKNKNNTNNIVSTSFYKFLVKNSKKRNKQYDNSMMFYNSLSLIMLSMLTGGIIGVILIIYYSFKSDDPEPSLNYCQ